MILVLGATGHIGSQIVQHLLANGEKVRCVARKFPNRGIYKDAELITGDLNEVAVLHEAMRGCKSAFVMLPLDLKADEPRFYANKMGEVIGEAIEESGIKKIVNLSSVGAEMQDGTGPVGGLHDQEVRLNSIEGVDILHLRATFFMENHLQAISSMIAMNRYFGTVDGDVPIDMVATRDIAARVAFLLMSPNFKGHSVEYILGPRAYSLNETVKILGDAVEKNDIEYVEVSDDEMRNYMIGAGLSAAVADSMLELDHGFSSGIFQGSVKRDKMNTSATTLEEFARTTFKDAYVKAMETDRARRATSLPPDEARF